jgi:ATP synthase protein I
MIRNMLANIGFLPRRGCGAILTGIGHATMVRRVSAAIQPKRVSDLGQPPRMSEDPPPDPLARLGEQIDRARAERLRQEASGRGGAPRGGVGLGLRMATELAAALIVGLALGWVVDRVFGTRPWGLIIFFFLGVAAGMVNVFRAAKGVGSPSTPQPTRNDDRSGQD